MSLGDFRFGTAKKLKPQGAGFEGN